MFHFATSCMPGWILVCSFAHCGSFLWGMNNSCDNFWSNIKGYEIYTIYHQDYYLYEFLTIIVNIYPSLNAYARIL